MGKEEVIVSIFFSDFPNRIRAKDMFDLFACHGEIVEVVIPPKKNKLGKRFGFARFMQMVDARVLAVILDNILIDGRKIHFNILRYERYKGYGGSGVQGGSESRHFEGENPGGYQKMDTNEGLCNGRSYVEVVTKEKEKVETHLAVHPPLKFSALEEVKLRLSKAFVGDAEIPGSTYNIQTHFDVKGVFSIKLHRWEPTFAC